MRLADTATSTMREVFTATTTEAMERDPRLALVLADISADRFTAAAHRHPERVINVGIREQAMIGVAGGLALAGMRPIAHTITPFLVERPFEQLKIDLAHQGVGAVLVSTGASYDYAASGRTHMAPADVALLDTLPGWTVHVPGHPDEARSHLLTALSGDGRVYLRLSDRANAAPVSDGARLHQVSHGRDGVVLAVGPTLSAVLDATAGLDVTVLYTSTVRPFDGHGLRQAVLSSSPDVAIVEPTLAGTSTDAIVTALRDLRHRVLALGVRRDVELRAYGTAEEHERAHGLDAASIADSLRGFFRRT